MVAPSLALAFATIERPQVVQRLVRSVRRHAGNIPIYVADQSRDADAMLSFYAAHDVRLVRMPFDCGVTVARNRLVEEIAEDFFVLCDDDFILSERTDFSGALALLASFADLAVVGGRLDDYDGETEYVRNWEIFLELDRRNKLLLSLPIYHLAPRLLQLGAIKSYLCDAVLNFAVFRRAAFNDVIRWDPIFKSNGEHEDFYLNLKTNSSHRVAYLPTMTAYHHHPENFLGYRRALRDRTKGWQLFFQKWGIEQHVEVGLGVRSIDDFGRVVSDLDAQRRFFFNPPLSLQREDPLAGGLVVNATGVVASVAPPDDAVHREDVTGTVLLHAATRQMVAGRVPPRPRTVAEGIGRYAFEGGENAVVVADMPEELHFRYDSVERRDADFLLWFHASGPRRPFATDEHVRACARWTGSDGTPLVWRSQSFLLNTSPASYWRPLLLDVPLRPPGILWMRFDIMTDGGRSAEPVATGFLFPPPLHRGPARGARPPPARNTLALSRLPHDGAPPGQRGKTMEAMAAECLSRPLPFQAAGSRISIARDALAGLDILFFADWACLGRGLVSTRLPAAALDAPDTLSLPLPSKPGTVIGYGPSGMVALQPVIERSTS